MVADVERLSLQEKRGRGWARRAMQAVPLSADSRGTIDMAAPADGAFLYVQNGTTGNIDGFRVAANGELTLVTRATEGLPKFSAEKGGMEGIVAA
ncbi:hypothetical protein [Streptomyces sp. NPDC059455]|uniref:hypothetical protein n=1 Tax=Streptomyces sp. NPDC059455 TaxID=3346837 RepID=UPI0036C0927A